MADNILKTRIKLRYDSYANWTTNNPVLLAGEIAIATVEASDGTGHYNTPNILVKVGNGTDKYNDLKFASALAADVPAWAKESTKPAYTANEISGLDTYINGQIQDTDTQYTVVPVDGSTYKFNLMSRAKGETSYSTLVATIDLTQVDSRLDAIETALGEGGSVATQISNAIGALDKPTTTETGKYIANIGETDGIVEPQFADLNVAAVAGLQDALNAKQDNLTFDGTYNAATNKAATVSTVTSAVGALKNEDAAVAGQFVTSVTEANGVVAVTRAALAASDIPTIEQSQVNGLETALAGKQDNLVFGTAYDATNNKAATMADVTGAVADLNGAMHFKGKVETDPSAWTTTENAAYGAGDVVLFGYDEYVYDGAAWHKLGNESIYYLKSSAETDHAAIRKEITDGLAAKQDTLSIADTYNATSNKVATVATVTNAISGLAKADTATSGQYVTAVKQENGVITVSRAAIPLADITGAQDAIDAVDNKVTGLGNTKQDKLEFSGTYNASTNKVATVSTVTDAINALNKADTAVANEFVTAVKQENGVITVSRSKVSTDALVQGTNVLVLDGGSSSI